MESLIDVSSLLVKIFQMLGITYADNYSYLLFTNRYYALTYGNTAFENKDEITFERYMSLNNLSKFFWDMHLASISGSELENVTFKIYRILEVIRMD